VVELGSARAGSYGVYRSRYKSIGTPDVVRRAFRYRARADRLGGREEAALDDPVDIETLRTLVRKNREKRGLSLREAAAQADVPFNTLARVEKGHLPDLANFRRIVEWLGLPPERFFQPPRIRTETTPEVIAYHLSRDPNLTDAAAEQIAVLVRELYANLVKADRGVRVHLRVAPTFAPEASRMLGDLLQQMQQALVSRAPRP
jgi:transcriptional regulator with XRE-family HTH domain